MAEEDDYALGMGGSVWGDQVSISTRTSVEHPTESEDKDQNQDQDQNLPPLYGDEPVHHDYEHYEHNEGPKDDHTSQLHEYESTSDQQHHSSDILSSDALTSDSILGPPVASGIDISPFKSTNANSGGASSSTRSSRLKKNLRTSRSRKVQSTDFEAAAEDPLDPLGAKAQANGTSSNEDSDNNKDEIGANYHAPVSSTNTTSTLGKNVSSKLSSDGFQDIPLNAGTAGAAVAGASSLHTKDAADELVASRFKNLDIGGANDAVIDSSKKDDEDDSVTFKISVGDPHRVGDLTSAHTVYTVYTTTNSPDFEKKEASVTRRYKDFRWLFHALEHNNNGIIIPPPPDKQAVGRFNEDFVEQRRAALEVMLQKIAKHKVLRKDGDFRLFLESDTFNQDIKHRLVSPEELDQAQSSGLMSTLGGAFSFSGKFIETSQWYIDKKLYIDNLETQLKFLAKALEAVVTQRRELGEAVGEFALVLESLADIEVSKKLSELLQSFADAHTKIKDLYNRQCLQDIMSLSTTLDEYIRLISSIRTVFSQRQKAFFTVQQAEHDLVKKRSHLEKLHRQGKTLQDKISLLQADVEQQEQKVVNSRVAFDDISKVIIHEFSRIEFERIADFRNSTELFLENAVESQKEAIEIWETFYQLGFPPAQQ